MSGLSKPFTKPSSSGLSKPFKAPVKGDSSRFYKNLILKFTKLKAAITKPPSVTTTKVEPAKIEKKEPLINPTQEIAVDKQTDKSNLPILPD